MKKIIIFLGVIASTLTMNAQPGKIDSSFGKDGIVITEEPDGTVSPASNVKIVKGNKILVVTGFITNNATGEGFTALIRYKIDGQIDSTFGVNGLALIPPNFFNSSLVIMPDEKILMAGVTVNELRERSISLMRFLPNGKIDSAFGTNGLSIHSSELELGLGEIALLPDGKLIGTGTNLVNYETGIEYPVLFRFNADGSLDNSFGNEGIKLYPELQFDRFRKILVHPNGRLYVAGSEVFGDLFFMGSFYADGTIDSSFGTNGVVLTDIDVAKEYITDIALQPDDKMVAVGPARIDAFPKKKSYMAAVRYNTDGSLDKTFGTEGIAKIEFAYGSSVNTITLQQNGKMVLGGYVLERLSELGSNIALARLQTDGSLDSTFGINGRVTTDLGSVGDQLFSSGLQSDGNIVALGQFVNSNQIGYNAVLIRYLGDPTKTRPTIAQIKRWIRNHILHFEDANTNATYYVIEKSTASNGAFVPVTKITANAATNNYSYTLPEAATQSTYRIKAVNKDNSITYSSPISSSDPAKAGVASFKVYPNPAKDRITVATSGTVQLRLQNSNGRVLFTQTVNGKGSIDISKLPNGIYYVVNTLNGESLKVVKE